MRPSRSGADGWKQPPPTAGQKQRKDARGGRGPRPHTWSRRMRRRGSPCWCFALEAFTAQKYQLSSGRICLAPTPEGIDAAA
eukprot:2653304-Rhodomonas_salina.1